MIETPLPPATARASPRTPSLSETLREVQEGLLSLQRQQRRLLVSVALLQLLGVLFLIWSLLILWVWRSGGSTLGITLTGLGFSLAAMTQLGRGLHRSWGSTSIEDQAAHVERLKPELRGRLLTCSQRGEGPQGRESPALLRLAARRSAEALAEADPAVLYPRQELRSWLWLTLAILLFFTLTTLKSPVGPLAALGWGGAASESAGSQLAAGAEEVLDERAVLANITLRYTYPSYTGLEPLVVQNSNGLAHGPPGTRVEVTARLRDPAQEAWLQVNEQEPYSVRMKDPASVQGSLEILEEGRWRFQLQTDAGLQLSPDFPLQIDPDMPPVVELETSSDRLQVPWNERIPLSWSVRDDFGISRVEVQLGGSKALPLRSPPSPPDSLRGPLGRTPQDLGLKPGDSVTLEIQAWDNDAVSGEKSGRSKLIQLLVTGPEVQERRMMQFREELRDALIDVLAPFAMDPRALPRRGSEVMSWSQSLPPRFAPLDAVLETYWDLPQGSLEGLIIGEIRRLGSQLLSTSQSFGSLGGQQPLEPEDHQRLETLRGDLVEQVESAILLLDRMIQLRAMNQILGSLEPLVVQTRKAEAMAAEGRGSELIAQQLSGVERIEGGLREAAAVLEEGSLRSLVESALESGGLIGERLGETLESKESIRRDALLGLLVYNYERLQTQIEQMKQEADEEQSEMQNRLQELIEALEELEREERELQAQTRQLWEELGGSAELAQQWERLIQESQSILQSLPPGAGGTVLGGGQLGEQLERLHRSIQARDAEDALMESYRAAGDLQRSSQLAEFQGLQSASGLKQLSQRVLQLSFQLERLEEASSVTPPALRSATQELSGQQEELLPPTMEATQEAEELSRELPMGAPGLVENLEGAEREMMRAQRKLSQGQSLEAQGAEEAAADRIRQALEALMQAASAMQELSEAAQGGGSHGGGEQSNSGEEDSQDMDIEIPPPEDYRSPEAYRRALLEGMQAEVPPEYEELMRQYYEELVRQ